MRSRTRVNGEGRNAGRALLRARRILVRRFPNHRLTERSLRISVGTAEENKRCIMTLERILKR